MIHCTNLCLIDTDKGVVEPVKRLMESSSLGAAVLPVLRAFICVQH